MPRPSRLRLDASRILASLAVILLVAVSCTTVASTPERSAPAVKSGSPSPWAVAAAELASVAPATLTPVPASARPVAAAATPVPGTPTPGSSDAPTLTAPPTLAAIMLPAPSASPVAASPLPSSAVPAITGTPELDRRTARKLQRIIDNVVAKKGLAGVQVAVRLPSGATWLGSAGEAEYDPDREIRADTQFAIASVTKTFVAALILQLAQEGKIDLDVPYGRYFRDGPRKDAVSVRQLLSHTSGIDDFWGNPRYLQITTDWLEMPAAKGLRSRSHRWTYEEMMKLVRNGSFKPGEDYGYSNTNYVILGQIAEAVEGQPLARQLRRRFFEPLGLGDTVYQPQQKPRADAAHGHWKAGRGFLDHTRDSEYVPFMAAASVAGPAGAMASSARDLAAWADALYGGDVLSPRLLRQMTTMLSPGYYGLGTDVAVFAGERAYGHRGGIRGFESAMWYLPGSGVSIALLSNHGNWYTRGISTDVPVKRMIKALLGRR